MELKDCRTDLRAVAVRDYHISTLWFIQEQKLSPMEASATFQLCSLLLENLKGPFIIFLAGHGPGGGGRGAAHLVSKGRVSPWRAALGGSLLRPMAHMRVASAIHFIHPWSHF